MVAPTYDQYIVKPPKRNVTHGRIPDVEFISSEDRNCTLYPNPNDYVIKLKDEYKNVTSVTLFNAAIPNTAYLVGQRNNLLYFQESLSGPTIIAELPVGDYCPDTLRAALEAALNAAGDSNYTVVLNTLINRYEFRSDLSGGDNIFNLVFFGDSVPDVDNSRGIFPPRSIGPVIGFNCPTDFGFAEGLVTVTNGSAIVVGDNGTRFTEDFQVGDTLAIPACPGFVSTVLTITDDHEMTLAAPVPCTAANVQIAQGVHRAPGKFDLSSDSFVVLDIRELEVVRGNATAVDRAFAVIPMIFPHNTKNFVVSPAGGVPPYKKFFNPPLPRLDRLTVRFTDYHGNLVDFCGVNNFMEFRILTVNQPGKYDPDPFI
jgi:hypothetical protein